ncbi:DUF2799 domain-containing protein [Psychrobacter sp. I-STPA6b]|uniref:DUF2799 domain-containing protein n=1 Tax=Psychrobacter sp. I-STPA6b TaxID=2585718 RepID=UPI001D0C8927|nr:DUF2799 domain-containing protein [Psychrobacter sp. I-STPA6b]
MGVFQSVRSILILASIVILSGCATLSKEECRTGNWEAIGFSDGASGYTPARLNSHNKACAKVGIAPDYQAWERGRQAGLTQYCTRDNAYIIGKRGQSMNAVCPASMNTELQSINADGRRYHTLSQQLTQEQQDLEKYREEYRKLRDGDNLGFKTEKEARAYLVGLPDKIRRSEQRISEIQRNLTQLQRRYGY